MADEKLQAKELKEVNENKKLASDEARFWALFEKVESVRDEVEEQRKLNAELGVVMGKAIGILKAVGYHQTSDRNKANEMIVEMEKVLNKFKIDDGTIRMESI